MFSENTAIARYSSTVPIFQIFSGSFILLIPFKFPPEGRTFFAKNRDLPEYNPHLNFLRVIRRGNYTLGHVPTV